MIGPAPRHLLAPARACPGPPSTFSTYVSGAPDDQSPEGLAAAPDVTPPSRSQNTTTASLAVQLRSTTFVLPPKSAFTRHYLVGIPPQPDLLPVDEHLVGSGRQVLPFVGVADLEPGELLRVAHAPLVLAPLDTLQHNSRVTGPYFGPLAVPRSPPLRIHPLQLRQRRPHPRLPYSRA